MQSEAHEVERHDGSTSRPLFALTPSGQIVVSSAGVQVPLAEAEATRRRLQADGKLRKDLRPLRKETTIVFPTTDGTAVYDFEARSLAAASYHELLPPHLREVAPRAFEALGDIAVVKIPKELWGERHAIASALQDFVSARAVFHDHGVKGQFRVRELERIAGTGGSATQVQENGVTLHVDVGAAYFSPRLADERGRITELVAPGEYLVDLFGGVAPLGVQAAKAGARVTSVDLNPAAAELARQNAAANRVELDVRCGDARQVATELEPADRVVMNLPHGAKDFLKVACELVAPGGIIHHHEILPNAELEARSAALETLVGALRNTRHVRNYSATESHYCFDLEAAA